MRTDKFPNIGKLTSSKPQTPYSGYRITQHNKCWKLLGWKAFCLILPVLYCYSHFLFSLYRPVFYSKTTEWRGSWGCIWPTTSYCSSSTSKYDKEAISHQQGHINVAVFYTIEFVNRLNIHDGNWILNIRFSFHGSNKLRE